MQGVFSHVNTNSNLYSIFYTRRSLFWNSSPVKKQTKKWYIYIYVWDICKILEFVSYVYLGAKREFTPKCKKCYIAFLFFKVKPSSMITFVKILPCLILVMGLEFWLFLRLAQWGRWQWSHKPPPPPCPGVVEKGLGLVFGGHLLLLPLQPPLSIAVESPPPPFMGYHCTQWALRHSSRLPSDSFRLRHKHPLCYPHSLRGKWLAVSESKMVCVCPLPQSCSHIPVPLFPHGKSRAFLFLLTKLSSLLFFYF